MLTDTADDANPGERRRSTGGNGAPTVGVEEELMLLDPADGSVVPIAAEVIRACADPAHVVAESMRFMVEIRTPVCSSIAEVHGQLGALRRRVAEVASQHGILAVASGTPPYGMPDPPLVTDEPRYQELARRFPLAMRTNGICGCHVHVGVAPRQVAVEALRRLRPWLPSLIALTANSPIWDGQATTWASRRFLLASRWPTVVPAPPARSVEEYERLLGEAIASGQALDDRSVYFLARLSPRHPTIEVRAADMCLTVAEAEAYAALVRALVGAAVDDAASGRPVTRVQEGLLRKSCWSAARGGLGGVVTDPQTGSPVPAWELVDALVARARPMLRAYGDEARVISVLERIRDTGGGADRQRRLFRESPSRSAFVAGLATAMAAWSSTAS